MQEPKTIKGTICGIDLIEINRNATIPEGLALYTKTGAQQHRVYAVMMRGVAVANVFTGEVKAYEWNDFFSIFYLRKEKCAEQVVHTVHEKLALLEREHKELQADHKDDLDTLEKLRKKHASVKHAARELHISAQPFVELAKQMIADADKRPNPFGFEQIVCTANIKRSDCEALIAADKLAFQNANLLTNDFYQAE